MSLHTVRISGHTSCLGGQNLVVTSKPKACLLWGTLCRLMSFNEQILMSLNEQIFIPVLEISLFTYMLDLAGNKS